MLHRAENRVENGWRRIKGRHRPVSIRGQLNNSFFRARKILLSIQKKLSLRYTFILCNSNTYLLSFRSKNRPLPLHTSCLHTYYPVYYRVGDNYTGQIRTASVCLNQGVGINIEGKETRSSLVIMIEPGVRCCSIVPWG